MEEIKSSGSARRKGARRPQEVPRDVLTALERGEESANHMEQIALDMGTLLGTHWPQLRHRTDELRGIGLVSRMRRGGTILYEEFGLAAVSEAANWTSDSLRGFGAMAVGAAPGLDLHERLRLIAPFADDHHFAVREWAWLSVRNHVASEVPGAIRELVEWTGSPSQRLRRFAIEVTRPRGVWSSHIVQLKNSPEAALPLIEPVRADPSRYVQDSVANWVNDASKSRPDWAVALCERWMMSDDPSTHRICRRALRTVERIAAPPGAA